VTAQQDASGLMYRRNRYYDPEAGQFTQQDPIGIAGGLNLYGYAGGDPINFSDPFGLCPDCIFDAISVGAGINDIRKNGLGWGNGLALTADLAALAIPGLPAFGNAARLARARRLGTAGEAAVRGAFNIGEKGRIAVNGRNRVPDGLTADVLSEVKNVESLSFTRQLRDYVDFAQSTRRQFDLYVRESTRLSGPLQQAVEEGLINLRFIPNN
jgi:RHS repeat-associated protein